MKILTDKQNDRILGCLLEIEKILAESGRPTGHFKTKIRKYVNGIRDVMLQNENIQVMLKEGTP